MNSNTNSSNANASATEDYAPVDGSWVAELDDAKAELEEIAGSPEGSGAAAQRKRRGELLRLYMRLCRAYNKLRLWDEVEQEAEKGLKVCASYGTRSREGASKLSQWKVRFASYREQAQREMSIPCYLDMPKYTNIARGIPVAELPSIATAVIFGDIRLLEDLVAHGQAIDAPVPAGCYLHETLRGFPTDATPLLVACNFLAVHDSDLAANKKLPTESSLDKSTQCAMQLVRLGADVTRTLNLSKALDTERSKVSRTAGFDGKTALELARMTKRTDLVELMEHHVHYSPEERAEVVHCRCGSRLPWKACHVTGIGQSPHYQVNDKLGVVYRLSPLAKCPCNNSDLKQFECCWKDTSHPAYRVDATGELLFMVPTQGRQLDTVLSPRSFQLPSGSTAKDLVVKYASLFRSESEALRKHFASEGRKSRVASWDPDVYAGCLERFEDPDDFFLWSDLHWKVDKSELLRRAQAWNKALQQYCDDAGLVGDGRAQVVEKHKANPCAPCGRVGCKAFETEPKEFQRCSWCKAIAYCCRKCQKRDWAEHRKRCEELKTKYLTSGTTRGGCTCHSVLYTRTFAEFT